MAPLSSVLLLPLSFLSVSAAAVAASSPKSHGSPAVISLVQHSGKATNLDRRSAVATAGLSIDSGFWYGDFIVGDSTHLSMLIDTGSADVIVNPGLYIPGTTSENLNITFSNSYGTTTSSGSGSGFLNGSLFTDEVTLQGLTAKQTIGTAVGESILPHQGIVGFSGPFAEQFPTNSTSFFQSLCAQNQVDECRFGLALGSNGTGSLVMGHLDSSLYNGDLTTVSALEEWAVIGDLTVNEVVVAKDIVVELDSGTATIVGPVEAVKSVFASLGIQSVITSTPDGDLLTGYFPCDKTPLVGLSLPSQANASTAAIENSTSLSHKSTNFNIPAKSWAVADNGNNNCTAVLSGQDYPQFPGLWVFGQPFFQGLYVDHNFENGTVGFAHQKVASSSNTTTVAPAYPIQASSATSIFQRTSQTLAVLSAGILLVLLVI